MNTEKHDENRRFRPSDSYIHATQKGTGSACRIQLQPAQGDRAGCIFVELAVQNSTGGFRGGVQVFPTFDWENKIVIKLDRTDLAQILQVLRGMKEAVGDGKGLFHRSVRANTIIKFTHQIDPRPGYLLSVSRKTVDGALKSVWFIFDVNEAFTLMLALEQSMMYICLGIPEVVERKRLLPLGGVGPQPTESGVGPQPTEKGVEEVLPLRRVSGDAFD